VWPPHRVRLVGTTQAQVPQIDIIKLPIRRRGLVYSMGAARSAISNLPSSGKPASRSARTVAPTRLRSYPMPAAAVYLSELYRVLTCLAMAKSGRKRGDWEPGPRIRWGTGHVALCGRWGFNDSRI